MTRRATNDRIEEEASLWAARLEGGGMDDAARAELTRWLAADPEHRWVLSRYRQLSAEVEERLATLLAEEVRPPRRRSRRVVVFTGLAAAAAIAVIAAVGLGGRGKFATHAAERHLAVLQDGSRVELNARTELRVAFARGERRVRLLHGEALFDVAKETARPFIVETPAGLVRVTGTVFNVRAAADRATEVTVLDGHVRVTAGAEPAETDAVLAPGEQATIQRDAVAVRTLPVGAAQDVAAWRDGRVVFVDTPLAEAMARLADYHGRVIEVAPEVRDLRLGGRYGLEDLDGLLEEIERVLPVRVRHEASGAVRLVPGERRGS